MMKKRMSDGVAWGDKAQWRRIIVLTLGCILCGLLSTSVAASDLKNFSSTFSTIVDGLVQHIQVRNDVNKRRDPFRPIKKRRYITSSSKKARAEPVPTPAISKIKNPNWKLLGIIHGQYGRQAVIQVSPKERVFVRVGLEVVRSGWVIKTISKEDVRLEHSATSKPGKAMSEPKTFILSFSTRENTF